MENSKSDEKNKNGIWGFLEKYKVWTIVITCVILFILVFYWFSSLGIVKWPIETGFRGKTVWDWLQLAIIPVVLAGGALLFNRSERKNEIRIAQDRNKSDQEIAEDRHKSDQGIAIDRQREDALQNYIDRITELLLQNNLLDSRDEDAVRIVARTRTLTTLRLLDSARKGTLLGFLFEAGLINNNKTIISLEDADLRDANLDSANLERTTLEGAALWGASLSDSNLKKANLGGAKLERAHLVNTILNDAHLEGAYLVEAHLDNAHLEGAHLESAILSFAILEDAHLEGAHLEGAHLDGATMPDGKKYDPSVHTLEKLTGLKG